MLRFFLDAKMKTEPMNYIMSAENCIDEITQSTLSAIRSGKRTSTTRSGWWNGLPKVGDVIKFINTKDPTDTPAIVEVTSVTKISKHILNSSYFISQWVSSERWTLKYALDTDLFKKKNLYQVKFKLKAGQ